MLSEIYNCLNYHNSWGAGKLTRKLTDNQIKKKIIKRKKRRKKKKEKGKNAFQYSVIDGNLHLTMTKTCENVCFCSMMHLK